MLHNVVAFRNSLIVIVSDDIDRSKMEDTSTYLEQSNVESIHIYALNCQIQPAWMLKLNKETKLFCNLSQPGNMHFCN